MKKKSQRVALYARVSTDDMGQTNDTQLIHLRQEAQRRGYSVICEYTDEASGKTIRGRPGFRLMMDDASKHKFDAILVYKIDRLNRNTIECLQTVNRLSELGVDLIVTTQAIDTSTAAGRAMMQMIAVFAELESANTSERVKIGMERAKAEGKLCHAPTRTLSEYQIRKAETILKERPDISQRELASNFEGISRPVLIRELRRLGMIPEKAQTCGN